MDRISNVAFKKHTGSSSTVGSSDEVAITETVTKEKTTAILTPSTSRRAANPDQKTMKHNIPHR